MVQQHEVIVGPTLDELFMGWTESDRKQLLGLIELLEENGFDLMVNTAGYRAAWLSVEFIEPGETPDMLWATAFIDMQETSLKLRVTCENGAIIVDSG